ncbi:MmgE/PrpD family protein [bacterium]|nr:MmgE/PrpD family protein [bacterium]
MERSVTRVLADYVAGATFEQLPKEVVNSTKRLILDDIGCALGGFTMSGGKILIDFAKELGGDREATIIGEGKKVSCILAAGVNAQMAGVLDFNENWKVGHVGSAIAEAGISVGERLGSNGSDIINAIVVGYETSTRIAEGVWSRQRMASKFRPNSWQVFGPAITAAKLLNLDADKIAQTIGIAGGIAPTLNVLRAMERPSHMIKTGDFWWCWAGITAAFLAWKGFAGIPYWLDGDKGYWTMISDTCNWEAMTHGLGVDYHIVNHIHFKPWSTCRHMHCGLELTLNILRDERLNPDDIEKILFKSHSLVCSPPFDDPRPIEIWDAVFSVPWSISLAAYGHQPGPDWYAEERFRDTKIINLAEKVKLQPLAEADKSFQEKGLPGAIAEVTLKARGKVYTRRQEGMKGSPQRPLSDTELKNKFRSLALRVVSEDQTEKLIENISRFEGLDNVKTLTTLFG